MARELEDELPLKEFIDVTVTIEVREFFVVCDTVSEGDRDELGLIDTIAEMEGLCDVETEELPEIVLLAQEVKEELWDGDTVCVMELVEDSVEEEESDCICEGVPESV